ncbi:MAG: hypothetical protein ABIB71_01080 [Candidatus Woesearchaeota archaeon]
MALRTGDKIYEDGNLVIEYFFDFDRSIYEHTGPEFFNSSYRFRFFNEGLEIKRLDKTRDGKREDYLLFKEGDITLFEKLSEEWQKASKGLSGYIATGSSFRGCTGALYFPPNSEDKIRLNKEEYSHRFEEDEKAGLIHKVFKFGNFEAEIKRFEAYVYTEDAGTFIRMPCEEIFEAFSTYSKRKHLYKK